tara:strand:+ start:288 stop:1013 length:726 start_codon:yes stop_codon:yes gene_type:complete
MAPAPKYKLYHGSTYIGSFKYSDDAETYCEAMQKAGKIIGELTIRSGHTKSSIELTYPKLTKAVVVDTHPRGLEYANIVLNNGEIESIDIAGKEYGVSIHDIGDEPSDVADYVPQEQSCIEITSSHGRWIVQSLTGTVREWDNGGDALPGTEPEDYANITRFDLTEYRVWRGMRPAELPQGGGIDVLLVGYWYTVGSQSFFEEPSAQARDDLIEQCQLAMQRPTDSPEAIEPELDKFIDQP